MRLKFFNARREIGGNAVNDPPDVSWSIPVAGSISRPAGDGL
jgi:hypothetical protein